MRLLSNRLALSCGVSVLTFLACRTTEAACPAVSPGQNVVQQWNKIAEDATVGAVPNGAGALQNEALLYMSYESAAVYDVVAAIQGGLEPYTYRPRTAAERSAVASASVDAAVIEAAYQVLRFHFPSQAAALDACHDEALAQVVNGSAKSNGITVGVASAFAILQLRAHDGRQPIGTSATLDGVECGPGTYRQTPGTGWALGPQTPWLSEVQPFLLRQSGQFQAPPPPALTSRRWVEEVGEIKRVGGATSADRTSDQTAIARFWTANVVRQYNVLGRQLITQRGLPVAGSARLLAMLNMVMADAQMSVFHEKYRFLFWRPVTAIDASSVMKDWCDAVPGYADGNRRTAEESGWRPLLNTPNHPEYPAVHGSITSAVAEVLSEVFGTTDIDVDIHGFDAGGPAGNLDAIRHFDSADDLRAEIVNARLWAGLHYRGSSEAAVSLGAKVAQFGLKHALKPEHD